MLLKVLFLFILIVSFCSCQEQINENTVRPLKVNEVVSFDTGEHIRWEAKYMDNEIILIAHIKEGWVTYSQYSDNALGPIPTHITFEESNYYSLIGNTSEDNLKVKFDKEINSDLSYFETKAIFKQKIKFNSGDKFVIKGNVNFMTCNENGCEPPVDFPFEIEMN